MLSLNDFNMPKVFNDKYADAIHVVYLILLDKGKFQSHPNMGVGLRTEWRFRSEADILHSLQNEIYDQINTYLPDADVSNIKITINEEHKVGIIITCGDSSYPIAYDTNSDTLQFGKDAEYII